MAAGKLGRVLFAPFRLRLWPGKYREPDVLYLQSDHSDRMREEFWEAADLVIEVVSDNDRRRDLDTKRREYAQARIPECWIVDPQSSAITVLRLADHSYEVHGEWKSGERARSQLLAGFEVDVTAVFACSSK